jgi:F-type H+-transporting ATPase subunit a
MRFSSTNVQSLTSNPIVLNAKPTGRAVFHGTVRNMSLYSNNLMALYPIQGPSIPITIGERIKVMTQISTYLDEINAPLGSFEALRQFRCELILEELNRNDRTWLDLYLDIIRENGFANTDLARAIRNKLARDFPTESPLDQFSIYPIYDLFIGNYYFSFTNLALSMLLTLVLVVLLFFVVTKKGGGKSVPNAWQSLVELIYDFVLNLVNEQIGGLSGNVKQKFFPRISVTFTFSLFRNPQGMIPFSFTVTSHFLITLALSFSIFIGITIVGFQRHGLHFFSFLLPAGVPLPLAPFLVLLELISYCFRALSLGIRLFANMMAGHSLVKILSGFAWTMLFLNNIFYFIGDLGPLFIVLALTGLELGVAISQAHVSTISICIYLNDATNLHQNESFHN